MSTWDDAGLKPRVSARNHTHRISNGITGFPDELRPAIRTVFDCTISNLSDEGAIEIAEKWQHHGVYGSLTLSDLVLSHFSVPALQPDADKESLTAALALLICGCVAAERYSLLSVK